MQSRRVDMIIRGGLIVAIQLIAAIDFGAINVALPAMRNCSAKG
jgi:hypothetical protein